MAYRGAGSALHVNSHKHAAHTTRFIPIAGVGAAKKAADRLEKRQRRKAERKAAQEAAAAAAATSSDGRDLLLAAVGGGGASPSSAVAAVAAVQPMLPAGWSERADPSSGRTYYVNLSTSETSWTLPAPAAQVVPLLPGWAARNHDETGRVYYHHVDSGETSWTLPTASASPTVAALPAGWVEHLHAEQNRPYYHHAERGETSWVRPTAGAAPAAAVTAAAAAAAATSAALPPGWEAHHHAEQNRPYYYHAERGETSWELPVATAETRAGAAALPVGWAEHHHADSGRAYYVHADSGNTSWTLPSGDEAAADAAADDGFGALEVTAAEGATPLTPLAEPALVPSIAPVAAPSAAAVSTPSVAAASAAASAAPLPAAGAASAGASGPLKRRGVGRQSSGADLFKAAVGGGGGGGASAVRRASSIRELDDDGAGSDVDDEATIVDASAKALETDALQREALFEEIQIERDAVAALTPLSEEEAIAALSATITSLSPANARALLVASDWNVPAAAEAHFDCELREGLARQQADLEASLREAADAAELPYVVLSAHRPHDWEAHDVTVRLPNGRVLTVEVPPTCEPGHKFEFRVPREMVEDAHDQGRLFVLAVTVPPNTPAGTHIKMEHEGKEITVVVPPGMVAGQRFKVQITAADLAKAPLAASCTCPLKTRPPSRPHRHGLHRETSSRLATALFVLR